jgi:HlyD family secretion protein
VYQVDSGPVIDYIEDTGEVVAENSTTIYSDLNAKVTDVFKSVGDVVKKGEILYMLDDETLVFQLEGLKANRQGLSANKTELEKPTDKDMLQKLNAVIASAKLNYEQLDKQLAIQKSLFESGAVSKSVVDDLESSTNIAYSNYQAAVNDYQMMKKGTSVNIVDQANSSLTALEIQIAEIESMIEKTTIKAQLDGVVVAKLVSAGDYVMTGSPLMTIEQLDSLYIKADLLADDIMMLKEGSRILISNDAGFEAEGKIRMIYPKAHTKISDLGVEQKRVTVEIDFEYSKEVKLGYEYDLEVVLSEVDGIRIPDSARFKLNGIDYVFAVKEGKAVLTQIEVLDEGVDYFLVSGLQIGDYIIQSPANELEDGIEVEIELNDPIN